MDALSSVKLAPPPAYKRPPEAPPKDPGALRQIATGERAAGALQEVRTGPLDRSPELQDVLNDQAVRDATEPSATDNPEAQKLKADYRDAYQKTEDGRAWAQELVEEYGEGLHQLPGGETISVQQFPTTLLGTTPMEGKTVVKRREADGTLRTVIYDAENPLGVEVFERDLEGNETTWKKDGSTVSVDRRGEDNADDFFRLGQPPIGSGLGGTWPPHYPPDAEWGNPTRMRYDGDQLTVTEVNRDGSTDTRTSDTLTWEWSDRHTPFSWNLGPIDWGRIQS